MRINGCPMLLSCNWSEHLEEEDDFFSIQVVDYSRGVKSQSEWRKHLNELSRGFQFGRGE